MDAWALTVYSVSVWVVDERMNERMDVWAGG